MTLVSDIKLIRTDTTLDLSQKAEKGIPLISNPALLILPRPPPPSHPYGTNPTSERYFYVSSPPTPPLSYELYQSTQNSNDEETLQF
jgi:hypothetical protein